MRAPPGRSPSSPAPPVTGAWREGDHPGRRRFADLGSLTLETGGRLPAVRMAYETWGRAVPGARQRRAGAARAHRRQPRRRRAPAPGTRPPGWWDGLIGPGRPIDTDRWFVVAPERARRLPGHHRPVVDRPGRAAVRQPVPVRHRRATRSPPRRRWPTRSGSTAGRLVLGGSMGGMRALEWAVTYPDRVERLLRARHRRRPPPATRSPGAPRSSRRSAPTRGSAAATTTTRRRRRPARRARRRPADRAHHLPVRRGARTCASAGAAQTGENPLAGGGRYAVESYLDHHADKLVAPVRRRTPTWCSPRR